MFSLKDTIRKTIVAVSLAALTTSFFTGCSKETPVTSSDLYPPTPEVITQEVQVTLETTEEIKDETHDSNTFSIKYKYWYDNPDVQKAQEETLAQNDPGGDNPDGTTFLDLAGLPVYTDPSGNQYIISGRTIVYLNNNKISGTEALLLRDSNGNKIYFVFDDPADVVTRIKEFANQAKSLTERKQNDTTSDVLEVTGKTIYVNNLATDSTAVDDMIPVSAIFNTLGLGSLNMSEFSETQKIMITMDTAAGFITVTLKQNDDTFDVSYSTKIKGTSLSADEISVTDSDVLFTTESLERILGYDVEIYDDSVNIITDNHDIFSSDNILSYADTADKRDESRNVKDESELDPENPIPVSKPAPKKEETKPTEETPSKPTSTKTPDGKYDLADTDVVNDDGTYSQTLGTGDPNDVYVPSCCTEVFARWTAENASNRDGVSNPSKIPYSQITVDNAAEAFPYLGWIGYDPDYIEIMPEDDNDVILRKIWNNLVGTSAHDYFQEGFNNGERHAPTHFFSSEKEYNEWEEEQNRIAEERIAQERQALEEQARGEYHLHISEEAAADLINSWRH